MGRHTDPVCKLCRREGIKLYLKGSRCESPKCAIARRDFPPGMHGHRRGKPSEYGIRLREKQKLKRFYGLLERQFRRYFELASRSPENTGEVLLSILERRLDNVVYRLGFAVARRQARQLVRHGHIAVNGRKVNIPSYQINSGDEIEVRENSKKLAALEIAKDFASHQAPPTWLEVDRDAYKGRVIALPKREDINLPINEQLIVELYSK